MQPDFVGLVRGCRWTRAASGTARRANVGLRSASSCKCKQQHVFHCLKFGPLIQTACCEKATLAIVRAVD